VGTRLTWAIEPIDFVTSVVRMTLLVQLSFVVSRVSSDPLAVAVVYLVIILDLQNELPLPNDRLDV